MNQPNCCTILTNKIYSSLEHCIDNHLIMCLAFLSDLFYFRQQRHLRRHHPLNLGNFILSHLIRQLLVTINHQVSHHDDDQPAIERFRVSGIKAENTNRRESRRAAFNPLPNLIQNIFETAVETDSGALGMLVAVPSSMACLNGMIMHSFVIGRSMFVSRLQRYWRKGIKVEVYLVLSE